MYIYMYVCMHVCMYIYTCTLADLQKLHLGMIPVTNHDSRDITVRSF